MTSAARSPPLCSDCKPSDADKGVSFYGVTSTGNLHVLRLSESGIHLQHIVPSMHAVATGQTSILQMAQVAAMEVCFGQWLSLICFSHNSCLFHASSFFPF